MYGMTMNLVACQTDTIYHKYQIIPSEKGWQKKDTLQFTLPSDLTHRHFNMEIGIRHSELYPYQDIWMEIRHPLSSSYKSDTLHIYMADDDGNWKGKGTSGSYYQLTKQVGHITLHPADSILQVVSLMKDNTLKGIHDIGIRLSPFTGSINTQKDKK